MLGTFITLKFKFYFWSISSPSFLFYTSCISLHNGRVIRYNVEYLLLIHKQMYEYYTLYIHHTTCLHCPSVPSQLQVKQCPPHPVYAVTLLKTICASYCSPDWGVLIRVTWCQRHATLCNCVVHTMFILYTPDAVVHIDW